MKYLLDSDIVSEFYETASAGHVLIAAKLATMRASDGVCISILTLFELEYGYANAPEEKRRIIRRRIRAAGEDFEILPLSANSAKLYGRLKKEFVTARGLDSKRSRLHNIDIMVAATAVAESCALVSADSIYGDLLRFESSLLWENWLA